MNGSLGFLYEIGGLASLMETGRPFLDKGGSPAAVLRFALPGFLDDSNPDALHSNEIGRGSRNGEAMSDMEKGGIDLNATDKALEVGNSGEAMKFNVDPATFMEYQNAPGFVPVILNIEPLESLPVFLGAREEEVSAGVV
jgi:hypothetical protein